MDREEDVKNALIQILRTGILRIRQFGTDGKAGRCSLEADHLHNLPELIARPNTEALRYYLDIERPSFIQNAGEVEAFDADWRRLDSLVTAEEQ